MLSQQSAFEFLPLGAIIQKFLVGETNIVQGFPSQSLYQLHNQPFFGETIGRVANRVANAKIDSLNNKSYALAPNNGVNSLHGGITGWGKRIWDGPIPVGKKDLIPGLGKVDGGESLLFQLRSDDGDEGYPCGVEARIIYATGTQTDGSGREARVLGIEYEVKVLEDDTSDLQETVVNVTNHSYFNLTGNPTIEGTNITLSTSYYLRVDEGGIPTTTTPGTYPGITANIPFTLGATHPDIDHCFVLSPSLASSIPIDTRSSPLNILLKAYHPQTKIHLEVLSTDPAFQFYTGKYIDVPEVEGMPARGARAGFCVEPSRYVDAVNREEWKGQVVLKRGQVYGSRTVYKGWSDE